MKEPEREEKTPEKRGGRYRKPTEKRIVREMADIAFSAEEKTADRLRALDLLSDLIGTAAEKEEAMAKLDALLHLLDA